jgi:hypothetical protein
VVEGSRGSGYTQWRRGGRVVECGGLENRYVGNPGVGGSNPPLSAIRASQHAPANVSACQHVPCGDFQHALFEGLSARGKAGMLKGALKRRRAESGSRRLERADKSPKATC